MLYGGHHQLLGSPEHLINQGISPVINGVLGQELIHELRDCHVLSQALAHPRAVACGQEGSITCVLPFKFLEQCAQASPSSPLYEVLFTD